MTAIHNPDDCLCGGDVARGVCPCPCEKCQAGRKYLPGTVQCPTCFTGRCKPKTNCAACLASAKRSDAARRRSQVPTTAERFERLTGITIGELRDALLAEAHKGKS